MVAFTSDQWVILALVFVLGLLIGAFLFAGSGRKWKHRYRNEVHNREEIEERHRDREREWDEREKEWRERDSLRGAAIKDRDRDGDGVPDNTEY
ncbi:MAG TPA: hypothetical protein VNS53_08395 [Sphingomicrobium sp.]|jgi:hypothetical protein|nr:hypothetical protein [Sphingomicrobium sp.]